MPTMLNRVSVSSVFFLSLALLLGGSLAQNTSMIFQISIFTNNAGFCLPLFAPLKLSIDWGDNTGLQNYTATTGFCASVYPGISHVYALAGSYIIKLHRDSSPTGPWLTGFGNYGEAYWRLNSVLITATITRVISFGDLGISSLSAAFAGCQYVTEMTPTLPSTVRSLFHTFDTSALNSPNISLWNTSGVTEFSRAFYSSIHFNQPLDSWDVSSATSLESMFIGAAAFNQPLSSWRFADGVYLDRIFSYASAFNQPLDMWDISRASSIEGMFFAATSFNQPLNSWNTSGLTSLSFVFNGATSFNQPLDRWNTSRCIKIALRDSFFFFVVLLFLLAG
jgi:hypothetical protein